MRASDMRGMNTRQKPIQILENKLFCREKSARSGVKRSSEIARWSSWRRAFSTSQGAIPSGTREVMIPAGIGTRNPDLTSVRVRAVTFRAPGFGDRYHFLPIDTPLELVNNKGDI